MSKGKVATLAALAVGFAIIAAAVVTDQYFLTWFAWGALFVVLESKALIDRTKGDTLSEQVQKGTLSRNLLWKVFWSASVGTLLVWLIFHLLLGY